MNYSGFLKILFMALFATIALQSCDMGRYYFNMHPGGKHHSSRNLVQNASVSPSFSHSEETKIRQADRDTLIKTATTDAPALTNRAENIVPEPVVQQHTITAMSIVSKEKASSAQTRSAPQKSTSAPSEEAKFTITLFGGIVLVILAIGIIVFFIAWIFAPVALALKIALWTLAGLSVLTLIGFIRALCLNS